MLSKQVQEMNNPSHKVIFFNTSNMETFPVYPYAFIQVAAIARRFGIDVICQDLLGIPQENWPDIIRKLASYHQPDMILITLRNTDSLSATDYDQSASGNEKNTPYFPIRQVKNLISTLRRCSSQQIVLGGFGFSVLPDELMHYLKPDFGVFGGPDDFFEKYTDILAGKVDKVANLLYFKNGKLISNPRKFFPPFDGTEYTPTVINEMMDFYESFPDPGFLGAPIEINRGCIHECVFCSEPLAKGNRVQYRDISLIMKDIELLYIHGIRKYYMITSELNPEGNTFTLELANAIKAFNSKNDKDSRITWFGANYLLNFTVDEFQQLYESGFTGGWFDITALDDDNARKMRTPYRNHSVIKALKDYAQAKRGLDNSNQVSEEIDQGVFWTMFMGNPAITIEAIRKTLEIANREGIAKLYDSCGLSTHIRVFDYEEPDEDTLAVTYSITEELERMRYDQLLPSFAYPPALLRIFSEEEIRELFQYLGSTYLSTKYIQTREWREFYKNSSDSEAISNWISGISNMGNPLLGDRLSTVADNLENCLDGNDDQAQEDILGNEDTQINDLTNILLDFCFGGYPEYFEILGLPSDTEGLARITPYGLAKSIYSRWGEEEQFLEDAADQAKSYSPEWVQDLLQFCVQVILYKFDIVIKDDYKALFA